MKILVLRAERRKRRSEDFFEDVCDVFVFVVVSDDDDDE